MGIFERGGDIDLLVDDLELAERTLIRHLGASRPDCQILLRDRVLLRLGTHRLAADNRMAGCPLSADRSGSRKSGDSQRRVARAEDRARGSDLVVDESPLGEASSRSDMPSVIRQAVEADGVRVSAGADRRSPARSGASASGERLSTAIQRSRRTWARSLRRAVWWRACFRSPVRTIRRYFAFVFAELRLRFAPPVPWIAILGADGSVKSALTNGIVDRFAACPYASVKAFALASDLMLPRHRRRASPDPHERPWRGLIGSRLRLLVLAADWLVGYWTRLVHLRAKGYILAFDSTSFDLRCRPEALSGPRRGPRLARALSWLLPKPDLVFVLDSEPDVLWQASPPVSGSELEAS